MRKSRWFRAGGGILVAAGLVASRDGSQTPVRDDAKKEGA